MVLEKIKKGHNLTEPNICLRDMDVEESAALENGDEKPLR